MAVKVLVIVPMEPSAVEFLRETARAEVDLKADISPERLGETIGDYQVLIAGTSTPLGAHVLDRASRLELICILGMGRTLLDLEKATQRGILVMNPPSSVAVSIAEHTVGLMLCVARRIAEGDSLVKSERWHGQGLPGQELRNKVLGVIGFGSVGALVGERAKGLQMKVVACDPHRSAESVSLYGCSKVSLEDLLSGSDVITIHAPLNQETRGMIGRASVSKMKPGVILINCSAAEILEEDAVYEGLVSDRIAGAGFDLHDPVRMEEHPLYRSERVICTPNVGAFTREALVQSSQEVAAGVAAYLEEGKIRHAVNLPWSEELASEGGRRWLQLGAVLGRFVIQLHPHGLIAVDVDLAGEKGLPPAEVFTRSVLKGILESMVGEAANLVNARSLAEGRGLRVTSSRRSADENFSVLATVAIETDGGRGAISGTLFDGRHPRIVRIDDYELEAVPDGDFLVIFNRDRPGVIADVGETLGRNRINIGQMYNGRDRVGGRAITLLRTDGFVPDGVLAEIRGLSNILDVTLVKTT